MEIETLRRSAGSREPDHFAVAAGGEEPGAVAGDAAAVVERDAGADLGGGGIYRDDRIALGRETAISVPSREAATEPT